MMNPRISTSFPLYDWMLWVNSEFARIESTSCAKVSRGISFVPARRIEGANATNRLAAKCFRYLPNARISLR